MNKRKFGECWQCGAERKLMAEKVPFCPSCLVTLEYENSADKLEYILFYPFVSIIFSEIMNLNMNVHTFMIPEPFKAAFDALYKCVDCFDYQDERRHELVDMLYKIKYIATDV